MIKGSIKLYEEPDRYKYPNYGNSYENWYDDWQRPSHTAADYDRMKKSLEELLERSSKAGYVVGSRVRKSQGYPLEGTIVKIHDSVGMAKNYATGALEPFRVKWDMNVGTNYTPPEADFGYMEINLIKPAPALLTC